MVCYSSIQYSYVSEVFHNVMVSKAWNRSPRPGKNPKNIKTIQYLIIKIIYFHRYFSYDILNILSSNLYSCVFFEAVVSFTFISLFLFINFDCAFILPLFNFQTMKSRDGRLYLGSGSRGLNL